MDQEQLTLFTDDAVIGTGRPLPWPKPAAAVEPETEQPQQADELPFEAEDAA
ncbi:hypothetical protein [Streptomyces sp. NPDC058202]|uniref:hypothetical protein n=1 Tax=Streptomyces sp. NPDC058202 TaxID=3346380 RepID=UPI0036E04844